MARIVFDARALGSARTGIGRYLEGLVGALGEYAPWHEYCLLADCVARSELALATNLVAPWLPKQLWERVALPAAARRLGADVLHLPHEGFTGRKRNIRRVVTVHDLIPLHFQEGYLRNRAHAAWYRARLNAVRRDADVVLTVSHATAGELVALLGIEPERLRVIPTPVDARFVKSHGAQEYVERRFGFGANEFFLAVGSAEPRKNLVRVLEAHAHYARGAKRPKNLVLFGHAWRGQPTHDLIAAHGAPGIVSDLGGIADEDLVALYSTACALVFPSTYEGYGLPVVEAMACGCPVITSLGGALAEVAGGAAELVDPVRVEEIAAALDRVASDDTVRSRMMVEGQRRAQHSKWSEAVTAVLEAYGLA